MDRSTRIAALVQKIQGEVEKQSVEVSQINDAVLKMDSVVKQNYDHAQETSAAAKDLEQQVVVMSEILTELRGMVSGRKENPVEVP